MLNALANKMPTSKGGNAVANLSGKIDPNLVQKRGLPAGTENMLSGLAGAMPQGGAISAMAAGVNAAQGGGGGPSLMLPNTSYMNPAAGGNPMGVVNPAAGGATPKKMVFPGLGMDHPAAGMFGFGGNGEQGPAAVSHKRGAEVALPTGGVTEPPSNVAPPNDMNYAQPVENPTANPFQTFRTHASRAASRIAGLNLGDDIIAGIFQGKSPEEYFNTVVGPFAMSMQLNQGREGLIAQFLNNPAWKTKTGTGVQPKFPEVGDQVVAL